MVKIHAKWMVGLLVLGLMLLGFVNAARADDAERMSRISEMYRDYRTSFPLAPEISARDALALWKDGKAQFVDVREEKEMEVSILPGAVTWRQYRAAVSSYANKKVVFYCTIGYRSGERTQMAMENMAANIYNLAGGILAWLHAGGEVYKDGKPVKRVHVYGKKWDLAPMGYEGVYQKGWFW